MIISVLSALLVLLLCVSIHVLHILYCNYSKPPNRSGRFEKLSAWQKPANPPILFVGLVDAREIEKNN